MRMTGLTCLIKKSDVRIKMSEEAVMNFGLTTRTHFLTRDRASAVLSNANRTCR